MVAWASGLPTSPLIEGLSEKEPDNLLKTTTDIGPGKRRLRTTAGVRELIWPMLLDSTQLATWKTFYRTTTRYGALSITGLTDPDSGDPITVIIDEPPAYNKVSHNRTRVQLSLKVLP
jgi:hypothetical protein